MKRGNTILAISSGGGHWVQLQRLKPAFDGYHVVWATVVKSENSECSDHIISIPDCNRNTPFALLKSLVHITRYVFKIRPKVIITTGAAPGLIALAAGRVIRAQNIWIDSIANTKRISLSGRMARIFSDHWLTQWEHLSMIDGPSYIGSVL